MIKAKFDPIVAMLEARMKAPMAIQKACARLINSAAVIAGDAFDGLLDLLNLPEADPDMTSLRAGLVNLKACLYLANDAALISIIDGAIAAIDGGCDAAGLPQDFISSTKSDIAGAAGAALSNALDGNVIGKLQKVTDQYQAMLVQLGIYDILSQLDSIVDCITSVCGDAAGMDLKVEEYRDKLKIGIDDMADPDFLNSENIDPIKKQALADSKTSIDNAKQAILNASYF